MVTFMRRQLDDFMVTLMRRLRDVFKVSYEEAGR
jgi:hypothetical protein